MASGDPLFGWAKPDSGHAPPTTNFPVPDEVGATIPQRGLNYARGTDTYFPFWLPNYYSGGGVTLTAVALAPTGGPTSGNVVWECAFCRIQDGVTDLSSLTFATAQTFTATAIGGTVNIVKYYTKTIANGSAMNSIAVNERGILRFSRNTTNDTATGGNAQLILVGLYAQET